MLGKWDTNGRMYQGHEGKLTLYNKTKEIIVIGVKITQNLYKFTFKGITKQNIFDDIQTLSVEQAQSWDVWHKCFSHISYMGLKELHNKGLVEGFNVNTESQMTDCATCVQGKLTVRPFLGHQESCTKKGQITHINLWGKYDVMSIRGNRYYLLLVDDVT